MKILVLVTVRVGVSSHVSKCPKKLFRLSACLKHQSHVEPQLLMLESEAFPHRCHVTSLTAGGSGRLMTASRLQPTHFPFPGSGEQPISSLILVFLYPALCYSHQLPTKYLSRRVHLNGVHLSYLEPLASRRPLSHIRPNSENITWTGWSSELVISDFWISKISYRKWFNYACNITTTTKEWRKGKVYPKIRNIDQHLVVLLINLDGFDVNCWVSGILTSEMSE